MFETSHSASKLGVATGSCCTVPFFSKPQGRRGLSPPRSIKNQVWDEFGFRGCIIIGITNMKSSHLNKDVFTDDIQHYNKCSSYGLSSSGVAFRMVNGRYDQYLAETFKDGDTITMIYRRQDKILQFIKNHGMQIALLENVLLNNSEVNMVVGLRDWYWVKYASVTLLNFSAFK